MLKKILIWLLAIIVVLAAAAAIWLYMNDYFYKVTVSEKQMGPFTFVYMSRTGDYSLVGPDMDKFSSKIMSEYNVNPEKGFAFYYDDPKSKPAAELRSDIGFLLEGADAAKMDTIMKTTHVRWIGPKDYVVATFPLKGKMSYMMAAIKCYPELGRHMQAKGYKMSPAFEMYDMDAKKITIGFQIVK